MPLVGFEPTISAGERPQTYALDRAARLIYLLVLIQRLLEKRMTKETKLRIRSTTAKAALKIGNEAWVLKKRDEQRLEASQMTLRHVIAITKLYRERNQFVWDKLGVQNTIREKEQYQQKWLQSHIMDRNKIAKQALQYSTLIHSFSSLSYDRSKASSKASSPYSAIQSFLLQMRASSPFLNP